MVFGEGRIEAGPAGAALELGLVLEQRQAAQAAGIDAGVFLAQQAAAERGLGPVVQQNAGLFGRQVGLQAIALGLGRLCLS
jgi:urea transporter